LFVCFDLGFFFFGSTGPWTQGFPLVRPTGRHSTIRATPLALFILVILEIGSCFLPRPAWTTALIHVAGWHECTNVPSCWLRWDLINFLPGLASNHYPHNLSLPSR
jgi:hypothetical protein